MSLVVKCKIFRLFVNILTADDKYTLLNTDNLTQPIQMELSGKQETFPDFVPTVVKCSSKFEHFGKKR